MSELSEALLEAHVRHELASWRGEELASRLTRFVHELFGWLSEVRLEQAATPAQIMGVIDRYVIELRISGGIIELAGEISRTIFESPIGAETRLEELLGDDAYEGFAEKVARLDRVRRELIGLIARSEAAELAQAQLLARMISGVLLDTALTKKPLRRLFATFEARIAGLLAARLARRRTSATSLREQRLLELLDPDLVRSVADEIWSSVAPLPLSQLFQFITQQDLEDFVVLGFEFWMRYRKSAYFRRISAEVVAHFFRKYGGQSLAVLIDDMGVTEEMIARELSELLAPLVGVAAESGFLEQSIRARLTPFYRSPELLTLLEAERPAR
jgi:hypothetical protein